MMKKIYLDAGHQIINGVGTGVKVNGHDEAVEARKVVRDISLYLKHYYNIEVVTDNDKWSLRYVVNWLKNAIRPADLLVSIHFNAFHTSQAHGTEAFVPENFTMEEHDLALDLVNAIHNVTGISKRRPPVKRESESQHARLAILSQPYRAVNVLLEICFLSSPSDWEAYQKNYHVLISELAEVIREHYER